jgi:hypothetical protein
MDTVIDFLFIKKILLFKKIRGQREINVLCKKQQLCNLREKKETIRLAENINVLFYHDLKLEFLNS